MNAAITKSDVSDMEKVNPLTRTRIDIYISHVTNVTNRPKTTKTARRETLTMAASRCAEMTPRVSNGLPIRFSMHLRRSEHTLLTRCYRACYRGDTA